MFSVAGRTALRVIETIVVFSVVGFVVVQDWDDILPVTGFATASLGRARDGLVVDVRRRLLLVNLSGVCAASRIGN